MKKLLLLVLCFSIAACGYAYYQDTLAISDPENAPEGQGIAQAFCDRNGKSVGDITLFPAVYRAFDPETDKVGRFWNSTKITGARDYILQVTNQGATPCYFRTYIAFENNDGVFDELITINWSEGFTVTPLEGDLILPNDPTKVEKYRVYLVTTAEPLPPGEVAEPMLQLYLSSAAGNDDVKAIGEHYTIRAASEAVWLPEVGDPEYDAITIDLLGEPTMEHAKSLFIPDEE